jgi:hypothetical protein
MTNREAQVTALEQALARWAAERKSLAETRDPLVRSALKAGISKHRIHVLSGIARTTIDDILGGNAGTGE